MRLTMPSTMPRPARRMGTIASFLPARRWHFATATGVSTVTSSRGRSRVASKHISMAISEISSLNSLELVFLSLSTDSLCWIRGWSNMHTLLMFTFSFVIKFSLVFPAARAPPETGAGKRAANRRHCRKVYPVRPWPHPRRSARRGFPARRDRQYYCRRDRRP